MVVSGNSVCGDVTLCSGSYEGFRGISPFIFMVEEKPGVEKIDLCTEKEMPGPRLWANML